MGKKKGAAQKEEGFQAVKGKEEQKPAKEAPKAKPKPAPEKPKPAAEKPKPAAEKAPSAKPKASKPPKGEDDGFQVVVGRKEIKSAKRQAVAEQQTSEIVTREYPLHKDQVRPALAKKAQVEDDSNARLNHKEAQFPGNPSTLVISGSSLAVMRAEAIIAKILKEVKHDEAIPTSKYGDPMIGVIIGPKGQTLEKIRELAPNAKVQLPEEGGQYVSIYGQPADVQKIAAAIRQLSGSNVDASQVELSQEEVEVIRKVPKDRSGKPMHWILIGKGGCNIRRIREETGAELIVPPPNSPSDEYTLRGSVEACEGAWRIIAELLAELGENPDQAKAEQIIEAKATAHQPPRDPLVVPSITGARTAVAPKLQKKVEESKAHAQVRATTAVAYTPPVPKVQTPMETVDRGSLTLVDLPLPPSAHTAKAKQKVKELATENNVKITFDGNNSLRLDGFERYCLHAERAILRLLGLAKAEVPIPKSRQGDPMIGLVIGPGGATINAIRAKAGNAFVLLPDDGCGLTPGCVTIIGTPAELDYAIEVVRGTLKVSEEAIRKPMGTNDPSIVEVEMDVPQDRQGNPLLAVLIGAGGKNIKWIREESDGVDIEIPKTRQPAGVAVRYKLRGTEAQIQAAQRCIRILFDDYDQPTYQGQAQDNVLPPNPYANCTIIGGR